METQQKTLTQPTRKPRPTRRAIQKELKAQTKDEQPYPEYRNFIQSHYDGIAGKLTALSGLLTGHALFAGRVLNPSAFDITGCKRILDAGCGNGRHCKYLLRHADPDAFIAAFDLSQRMLLRAKRNYGDDRIHYIAADLTCLPYPDDFFDAVVCGWVLEHLPDPRPGLWELCRIMRPGGKLLLMTTEDTLAGILASKLWHCRTYNRKELKVVCEECGFIWHRPHYFTLLHRIFRLGGIIIELHKA